MARTPGAKTTRKTTGIVLSKIVSEIESAVESGDKNKLERISFVCSEGAVMAGRALTRMQPTATPFMPETSNGIAEEHPAVDDSEEPF